MPIPAGIRTFFASDFGTHSLLVAVLAIAFVLTGIGAGYFAKYEAKLWLCQYDAQTHPECERILKSNQNADSSNSNANANTAAPNPSAAANANDAQGPPLLAAGSTAAQATPSPGGSSIPLPTPVNTPSPVTAPTLTPITAEALIRLQTQASKVRRLIGHHGHVMAFFYQAYYTAICVVLFAGVLVAVTLFFIAKDGWSHTAPHVRTVFIVATAGAAFYGLWPSVFQQEKNISDNKALFLQYQALEDEIESYPLTRIGKNEPKEPNAFINYVDSELARLGNIAIGFDYTKITYKGAFDTADPGPGKPNPTPSPRKP